MSEVQGLGIGQRPRVPRREPAAVPNLCGQRCAWRDVEHHSTRLFGTPVWDRVSGKVAIHEIGEVPIKIREAGFADCIDSHRMFAEHLADLQARRILPP